MCYGELIKNVIKTIETFLSYQFIYRIVGFSYQKSNERCLYLHVDVIILSRWTTLSKKTLYGFVCTIIVDNILKNKNN